MKSAWDVIVINMLFYTDVRVKEDREKGTRQNAELGGSER